MLTKFRNKPICFQGLNHPQHTRRKVHTVNWGPVMMTSSNEKSSTLLAICAQRPVTRSFAVFFDLCPNKRLSKQSWGWWFETHSGSLWRHRNVLFKYLLLWFSPGYRTGPCLNSGEEYRLCYTCLLFINEASFRCVQKNKENEIV